ncbi:BZ3500_MvSof-1268-A1-R1_Chr8-1g09890 [Microbotryum saponariae]|uniref:BZ3500_MvSof-1268-A1-R1_Chr8-1g09890 protein n=1 Tax=Microbotryum saponariae TaxID=289078 RepID=A0A2X0MNP5_9BASI|nr:BZ3500_MvSof-1268-A1-R1_Chr8-1g09890 [Microbotryum saponariae]SDA08176.1 BZ3501_MvSof-1269-A2-R1_Chr8-1g09613 [Microbotryum saponariae]
MARRSAIQQERDRVQLEIENTEDALDKLVSFNYSLMQEMEMDSQSDYSTDATGTDTDASDGDAEYLDALKELRNDQFHSNYNSALAAEAHLEALHCEAADLARQRYLNRAHKYTPRPPGHGLDRCLDEDRQLNDEDFATELRMSRQAFNELYEAVSLNLIM